MTIAELLKTAKPILFKTEMVQAIMRGDKTQTRRIKKSDKPKYQVGDILYVRETWRETGVVSRPYEYRADGDSIVLFGEDGKSIKVTYRWRPSIFMPKDAARNFLEVTALREEKIQNISHNDIFTEGIKKTHITESSEGIAQEYFAGLWNSINAKPKAVYKRIRGTKVIDHYVSYPWEDIQETRTYRGKDWYVCGNPEVWVYGIEKKEVAQ